MLNDIKKILRVLKYFAYNYKLYLILLCFILILETFVGLLLILSIAPIADYLFDNTLSNPNKITEIVLKFFTHYTIKQNFWSLSLFFIIANFAKAGVDILTRFTS